MSMKQFAQRIADGHSVNLILQKASLPRCIKPTNSSKA